MTTTNRKPTETLPPKPTSHAGAIGMLRAMQCTDGAFGTCPMCGGSVRDQHDEDSLPVHKPGCLLKAALDAGPRFDLGEYMETLLDTMTRLYGTSSKLAVLSNLSREVRVLTDARTNPIGPWVRIAMLALEGAMRSLDGKPEPVIEHLVMALGDKIGASYSGKSDLPMSVRYGASSDHFDALPPEM